MVFLIDALTNFFLFLRNALVSLTRRPPEFVWIEVSGNLPEFEPRPSFLQRRLRPGTPPPSLEGIRERLRLLSSGKRPAGVVLRARNLNAGWATLEELRRELSAYRERGGRVVAYLIEAGVGAYYLASVADEVVATPLTTFDVTGVRASVTFLRDALDRVGVEAEVVAVSPYKSAYDRFARNDFSKESREQTERLVERRYEEVVAAVSSGRNLSQDEVRDRIDRAPFSAGEAVSEGLFDGACYEDELPEHLGGDSRAKVVEWNVARRSLSRPYRKRSGKKVGVVTLSGLIMRGRSRSVPLPIPLVGGEQAGDESVVAALRAAERNRRVGAVLFHVDSGGGDALASDLIWREVERIAGKKPVVVLMGNVAASGGYYVAAAASRIVVRRNTITGSIGVISLRPIAEDLFAKLGINTVSIERGARSGMLDAARRPTADEMRVLEGQILSIYGEFKERVSRGREIPPERLDEIAGGRVWTGSEAVELGLADEVGGFAEALAKARDLGGIKQDGPDALVKVRAPGKARPAPGERDSLLQMAGEMEEAFHRLAETRVWALSPYEIKDKA